MALFNLPQSIVRAQGIVLGYPYLLGMGSDMPPITVVDTETNETIWDQAFHMNISTNPTATVARHPLETGSSVMDHRIIEPLQCTLSLMATKSTYRDLYSAIRAVHENSRLVNIHTRTRVCRNMAITAMPDEQNPDMYDALAIDITFEEMVFVTPSQGTMTSENTRNKADANTIQQGQKSPRGIITAVNENAQQQALDQRIRGGM